MVVTLQYPFLTNRLMNELTKPNEIWRETDNSRWEIGFSSAISSNSRKVFKLLSSIMSLMYIAPPGGLHRPMRRIEMRNKMKMKILDGPFIN